MFVPATSLNGGFFICAALPETKEETPEKESEGKMEETKNKTKKTKVIIIAAAALAVCIAAVLVVMFTVGPFAKGKGGAEGTKSYILSVVDPEGAEKKYEGKTDAEFLSGLMDDLAENGDFSYDGQDEEFGFTLYSVNGVEADFTKDSAYWAIYVNGEYGMYGVDMQPVSDGDSFTLKYEKY